MMIRSDVIVASFVISARGMAQGQNTVHQLYRSV
jgi:hypothetical protein